MKQSIIPNVSIVVNSESDITENRLAGLFNGVESRRLRFIPGGDGVGPLLVVEEVL